MIPMKKIWYFLFLFSFSLLLFGCWKENPTDDTGTGWNISWTATEALISSWKEITSEYWDPSSGQIFSDEKATNSWALLSWNTQISQQGLFSIELCNQIIAFNRCIISKAPIENQPVMKEQLVKVIEPWKLLADAQLREICQETVNNDRFEEVRIHYKDQGCEF